MDRTYFASHARTSVKRKTLSLIAAATAYALAVVRTHIPRCTAATRCHTLLRTQILALMLVAACGTHAFSPASEASGSPTLTQPALAALNSARTLFSASLLVAAASVPATGSSLCLFADASLLLTGSRTLPCALTAPQGAPMRVPARSLACAQSLASATSTVRALHLIPTFMVASPSQRKRLIVLAHFNHGLICDVTQLVTWQTHALSVWRLPASDTFFSVQATLANRVSNRAFIQGTSAR